MARAKHQAMESHTFVSTVIETASAVVLLAALLTVFAESVLLAKTSPGFIALSIFLILGACFLGALTIRSLRQIFSLRSVGQASQIARLGALVEERVPIGKKAHG